MDKLSQSELDIIQAHPLNRENVMEFCEEHVEIYRYDTDADSPETLDRHELELMLHLLMFFLIFQPAAYRLPSRRAEKHVVSLELESLSIKAHSDESVFEACIPLLGLFATNKSDAEIWATVYDLAESTKLVEESSRYPFPFDTEELEELEELKGLQNGAAEDDDAVIAGELPELYDTLRLDEPSLEDAFFGNVTGLDQHAQEAFRRCQQSHTPMYANGRWVDWPPQAPARDVIMWLKHTFQTIWGWTKEREIGHVCPRKIDRIFLHEVEWKFKIGVGFTAVHDRATPMERKHHESRYWDPILIVGAFKRSRSGGDEHTAWKDLAAYVSVILNRQDRRYVLGFTLCGSAMRLYQFDRCGTTGSPLFDIHEQPVRFIRSILACYMMNEAQLGLDPTIHQHADGQQRSVDIKRNGVHEKLILTRPVERRGVMTSRVTSRWMAYRAASPEEGLFIKDSWQDVAEPSSEGDLLKMATERGAHHIARYYDHETVQVNGHDDDVFNNVRGGLKRQTAPTPDAEEQVTDSVRRLDVKDERAGRDSEMQEQGLSNRVHQRLVTRGIGRSLYASHSLVPILKGFIGALKGHESLLDAGILHRDISSDNIRITKDEDDGFLIDLDYAIDLRAERPTSESEDRVIPGSTIVFMSTSVSSGNPHSFMDDLESFFWVLMTLSLFELGQGVLRKQEASFTAHVRKARSALVKAEEKEPYPATILKEKLKVITSTERFEVEGLGNICEGYLPLRPLIRELYGLVFPNNQAWVEEDRALYGRMRGAFEAALEHLELSQS